MTALPITSDSIGGPAPSSPRWMATAPTIVAERLAPVPEPLLTGLSLGPEATGSEVAARLARSLAPAALPCPAPGWLRPHQVPILGRLLAALARCRGALLAEPVGSGKTYLALAAAWCEGGSAVVLAPAGLIGQWNRIAARLGVPIAIHSHQQVSRGRLPHAARDRLVVVDESHHYRNAGIRRYRHLATWLVGRRALLLSATPVVNRPADLANQLALCLRDDALAAEGIRSVSERLANGGSLAPLGAVIIGGGDRTGSAPSRQRQSAVLGAAGESTLLELLDSLRLSGHSPTAALIRHVLVQAMSSSPAALTAAAERYRRLLHHARDAAAAGRTVSRRMLLHLTEGLSDQLLLWELLPPLADAGDFPLEDLAVLDRLDRATRETGPDPKVERLTGLLGPGRCTLVFTRYRATVHYLRRRLAPSVAWCTGERAGIGATGLARDAVLGWFGPARPDGPGPRTLVSTDVAAEGLDLPAVDQVIHYDLPWTAARVDQREGRAIRAGSRHREVSVIEFRPSRAVEARLRQVATLGRKARLPGRVGLGPAGRWQWSWRGEVADEFATSRPACPGSVAAVRSRLSGLLLGYQIVETEAGARYPITTVLGWLDRGGWTEDPVILVERLREAAVGPGRAFSRAETREWMGRAVEPLQARMRLARIGRWGRSADPATTGLLQRLRRLAGEASRRRDRAGLARTDRGIALAAGGLTAGEAILLATLAEQPDGQLLAGLDRMPPAPPAPGALEVRIVGLVLFGS